MKLLVLVLMLAGIAVISKAQANGSGSMTATSPNGEGSVQLFKTPCPSKIKDLIVDSIKDQFQKALAIFRTRTYDACWLSTPEGVIVIDQDGDGIVLPYKLFHPTEGL